MVITRLFLNDCGNISRKGNRESFNLGVENTLTQAKGRTHHAIELYLIVGWYNPLPFRKAPGGELRERELCQKEVAEKGISGCRAIVGS